MGTKIKFLIQKMKKSVGVRNDVICRTFFSNVAGKCEFYLNEVNQIIAYFLSQLPNGSHVIMTGLANGRILWDTLSERQHLFGEYRQNANYQAFYTWLNCLEISPCIGWVSD